MQSASFAWEEEEEEEPPPASGLIVTNNFLASHMHAASA